MIKTGLQNVAAQVTHHHYAVGTQNGNKYDIVRYVADVSLRFEASIADTFDVGSVCGLVSVL